MSTADARKSDAPGGRRGASPAVTMMFVVSDAAMLNGLNKGDNVRCKAALANDLLTVTSISRGYATKTGVWCRGTASVI